MLISVHFSISAELSAKPHNLWVKLEYLRAVEHQFRPEIEAFTYLFAVIRTPSPII